MQRDYRPVGSHRPEAGGSVIPKVLLLLCGVAIGGVSTFFLSQHFRPEPSVRAADEFSRLYLSPSAFRGPAASIPTETAVGSSAVDGAGVTIADASDSNVKAAIQALQEQRNHLEDLANRIPSVEELAVRHRQDPTTADASRTASLSKLSTELDQSASSLSSIVNALSGESTSVRELVDHQEKIIDSLRRTIEALAGKHFSEQGRFEAKSTPAAVAPSGKKFHHDWKDKALSKTLVFLYTHHKAMDTRRVRALHTWGKHVPNLVTVTGTVNGASKAEAYPRYNPTADGGPVLETGPTTDSYSTLLDKVKASYQWVCDSGKVDEYEWFLKMDDDAFLVTYNMGSLLNKLDPSIKHYLGRYMEFPPQDSRRPGDPTYSYASGGGGYAFSRAAMQALCVADAWKPETNCLPASVPADYFSHHWQREGVPEDVYVGICAKELAGAKVFSSGPFSDNFGWGSPEMLHKKLGWNEFSGGVLAEWREPMVSFHYVQDEMYLVYTQLY